MSPGVAGFVTLASQAEIPDGTMKVFRVDGKRLAVSRVEGKFYAIDDVCTHDGGPLGGGLQGDEVECPRHGARFSVKTGAALCMPAVAPVKVYEVRLDGDHVQVKLG